MGEWGSYTLADFLMFSPRAYARLVDAYLREMWPAQVAAVALGLAALLAHRGERLALRRAPLLALALAWAWVGWGFFRQRYADIHIAGTHLATACAVQSVLLAILGVFPTAASLQRDTGPRRALGPQVGLLVAAVAVLLYPIATQLAWRRAEVAGLMPDPTALATLGLVLASPLSWLRRAVLLAIPLAMLAFGWATLWTLAQSGSGG